MVRLAIDGSCIIMSDHPFLDHGLLPKWSALTASVAEGDISFAISLAKQNLEAICGLKDDEINYKSVFGALDSYSDALNLGMNRLSHLVNVRESKELRSAYAKILPIVSEFESSVFFNPALWSVVKKAADKSKNEGLSDVEKRYVSETVKDFEENGADLPDAQQKRVTDIDIEITKISQEFSNNIKDSTNASDLYIANESDLQGLPQAIIDAAKESAISKNHPSEWRFTLQLPSRLPLMKFLENESIRKHMYELSSTIGRGGQYDNTEKVALLSKLRDEKAKILGFETYADFIISRRMAGSGSNALKFEIELHDKVYPMYMKEVEELKDFIKQKDPNAVLKPWNERYWSEKQRKELYDFDEEEIKPYFSTEVVLDGLFKIVQIIYDIEVKMLPTYVRVNDEPEQEGKIEVWHEDVMYCEVYDKSNKMFLGGIFIDLYPREDKRNGGWTEILFTGQPSKGSPNLVCLNGTLNKPVGGKPALLTHRNVATLFHEFGHCVHMLFYVCGIGSLDSMHVPFDFIELPSQFTENFIWEKEALDLFASHYTTKERIPNDLFNKMIAARNFHCGHAFIGQLFLGRMDLAMHQEFHKWKDTPIDELESIIGKDYKYDFGEPVHSVLRTFRHIYGSSVGYSAGYYSYKWSEVLDADCFSRFMKEGILNPTTGLAFRHEILEKGNTIPVQEAFKNFMGRDPSQESLLKAYGFLKTNQNNN